MAINPSDNPTMSGRITPPDADYPYGSSKNETSPGAGDGTPYFEGRANDIFGFQQALLTVAGIVPSGSADTALVSQYLESARAIFGNVGLTVLTSGVTFAPSDNAKALLVIAVGGGGGSGGVSGAGDIAAAAAGGGGGGTAIRLLASPLEAEYTVTMGAGGSAGGIGPTAGGPGGDTTFVGGSVNMSAGGGAGGGEGFPGPTFAVAGSDGGVATGGNINFIGGVGNGTLVRDGVVVMPGFGGGSALAPGRFYDEVFTNRANPEPGKFPGGGAAGGFTYDSLGSNAGQTGAAGVVIVIEFFNL